MIALTGLSEVIARLARLDVAGAQARGLRVAAALLRHAVAQSLSYPPGQHPELPALRGGALRASIGAAAEDGGAIIFSTSPVALFQELGSARMAPRPFLGPAAARHADGAAGAIADAVRAEISA